MNLMLVCGSHRRNAGDLEEPQSRLSEDDLESNTSPRGEKKKKTKSLTTQRNGDLTRVLFGGGHPHFVPYANASFEEAAVPAGRQAASGVGAALWPSHLRRRDGRWPAARAREEEGPGGAARAHPAAGPGSRTALTDAHTRGPGAGRLLPRERPSRKAARDSRLWPGAQRLRAEPSVTGRACGHRLRPTTRSPTKAQPR